MRREYVAPRMILEEYNLMSPVAVTCSEENKIPVSSTDKVTVSKVHCVEFPGGAEKNCSVGAHTHTLSSPVTIFADGAENTNGCTTDIYTLEEYVELLENSGVNGTYVQSGPYFSFNGTSAQHTASFVGADYTFMFSS